MLKQRLLTFAAVCAALTAGACSDTTTSGAGRVVVKLTDAPFPLDSLKSVDIFVVRVEARAPDVDEAEAEATASEDDAESHGWTTLATPNASIDLLGLQNGTTTTLGETSLTEGNSRLFMAAIASLTPA